MGDITELRPSPGHVLDIAKKKDCDSYVVIGVLGDQIYRWSSHEDNLKAYATVALAQQDLMDEMRGLK